MSQSTFNSFLRKNTGYWAYFVFLTEIREQKILTITNKIASTFVAVIYHDGTIKFLRINRFLLQKIRETCPNGNITDYLWQIRTFCRDLSDRRYFDYELRQRSYSGNYCPISDKETLMSQANVLLNSIPNTLMKFIMNDKEIEQVPAPVIIQKFGRKIII